MFIINKKQLATKEFIYHLEYHGFYQDNKPKHLAAANGKTPTKTEQEILSQIKPPTLIDLGCANGERMFSLFEKLEIDFIGLEKYPQFIKIAKRKWRNKIIEKDFRLTGIESQDLGFNDKVAMVTALGFALGGIHENPSRKVVFNNMANLLRSQGHLLIDTFYDPQIYHKKTGTVVYLFEEDHPPQYAYSKKELLQLAQDNGLRLVKETFSENENIVYLLFQKQ